MARLKCRLAAREKETYGSSKYRQYTDLGVRVSKKVICAYSLVAESIVVGEDFKLVSKLFS